MAVGNYTKVCNSCLINKSIDDFQKAKTGKYGVRGKCKSCNKEHTNNLALNRTYEIPKTKKCTKCHIDYGCNTDNFKIKIQGKYKLTSECRKCLSKRNCDLAKLSKYKEIQKNWNNKNIDKVRAYARKTALKYKEKYHKYQKSWRISNLDRENEKSRNYYLNNKDKLRPVRKLWSKNNVLKVRAYVSNYRAKKFKTGKHTQEDVIILLEMQKYKCIVCKCNLINYHVDHIEPISKGGSNTSENLQILCPTCNREKSNKDPIKFMQQKGFLL